ncbi:MAG: alpha/beta fold hydrolase [Ruminococcus sp.]|nr:alpha/beta fold hydrolase [Ruminococcus sp.]
MAYNIEKRYFPSTDKGKQIYYEIYTKDGMTPRAVVQISHGMCEYIRRYRDFARFLNDCGYIVVGNDHLGHGMTAAKLARDSDGIIDPAQNEERGWFSAEKGWQHCVADMHRLTAIMKKEYPDLPFILFAHSMGSLLGRAYVTQYTDEFKGVIFSGTSAALGTEPQLLTYLSGLKAIKGGRYRPDFTNKAMFGKYGIYNTKAGCRELGSWLNRDKDKIAAYVADPYCNFSFTINGFENLVAVNYYVNKNRWFEKYPKELPTYLISGSKDPVGDCGKGVLKVYNRLRLYDCDVELKLYNGARHEVINELNNEEVYADVADFIESVLDK